MTKKQMEREIEKIEDMKREISSMIEEQISILRERSELTFDTDEADNEDYCEREEKLKDLEKEIQHKARYVSIMFRDELIYKVGGVANV
ncbi:hypothetical protein [Romboutsia sp.]|uniref:hypothetical protein n=1 Tax=Romboutsia sp. TaxID=1965302 RepID=UPI002B97D5C1|nr:hypothetical protein [Romboutsia sp.]HSQ88726.1 hypothetical protein [Romboutsia sp.]